MSTFGDDPRVPEPKPHSAASAASPPPTPPLTTSEAETFLRRNHFAYQDALATRLDLAAGLDHIRGLASHHRLAGNLTPHLAIEAGLAALLHPTSTEESTHIGATPTMPVTAWDLNLTEAPPANQADRTMAGNLTLLRGLAAEGRLGLAAPSLMPQLRSATYALAWPLVWQRHTRRIEQAVGHHECASSLTAMTAPCLDRFYDDVDAVVDYLFARGNRPIGNLEGWITARIGMATVDRYRRRRGAARAMARLRVPAWLRAALGGRHELIDLAGRIIVWVSMPNTGSDLWPLQAWADHRAALTGTQGGLDVGQVAADVEQVLAVMRRTRPAWYESYIERPLGRKRLPTVTKTDREFDFSDHARAERVDSELVTLATAATDAICEAIAYGEDPNIVVPRVLQAMFLSTTSAVPNLADAPGYNDDYGDSKILALLKDQTALARLVDDLVTIFAQDE